jgi:hypothetical protein
VPKDEAGLLAIGIKAGSRSAKSMPPLQRACAAVGILNRAMAEKAQWDKVEEPEETAAGDALADDGYGEYADLPEVAEDTGYGAIQDAVQQAFNAFAGAEAKPAADGMPLGDPFSVAPPSAAPPSAPAAETRHHAGPAMLPAPPPYSVGDHVRSAAGLMDANKVFEQPVSLVDRSAQDLARLLGAAIEGARSASGGPSGHFSQLYGEPETVDDPDSSNPVLPIDSVERMEIIDRIQKIEEAVGTPPAVAARIGENLVRAVEAASGYPEPPAPMSGEGQTQAISDALKGLLSALNSEEDQVGGQ